MAPTASGPVCPQVQQATSPCLTGSRPPGLGSGRPQSTFGGGGVGGGGQLSRRQWQLKLRILKEVQPDQSMRQVYHFLQAVPQ